MTRQSSTRSAGDEFDSIMNGMREIANASASLKRRREALRTGIAEGNITIGDPVLDFCALHGRFDEDTLHRVADVRKRITDAQNERLLVETLFYYTVSMSSSWREYAPHGLQILRLTTIRQPVWTKYGLEIRGPYAYHVSSEPAYGGPLELFREENARRLPMEWSVESGPFSLGAGELFDDVDAWPSQYTQAQRPDLAQKIQQQVTDGPLHHHSNQIACQTRIYTGTTDVALFGDRYCPKLRESLFDDAITAIENANGRRRRVKN